MAQFRNTEQLYQVLDGLFRRVSETPEVAKGLLAGQFVLRFRYTDPDGQATVDLRGRELNWTFGETTLAPDLEFVQSADTAHQFWLGRLNITRAIATRKVVSRGPIAKALKLLPAIKPVYPLYRDVLRSLGHAEMLPPAAQPSLLPEMVREQWLRLRRLLPVDSLDPRRWWRRAPAIDFASLNRLLVPLVQELPEIAPVFRDHQLPLETDALKREMLDRMLLIRHFEQALSIAYAAGEVPTEAIHLSIGQEAVAVGVCFALRSDDYIATTHRGHGHMLAKGADLAGMMAEILGKASGLCAGKGGSMHVTDAAIGALGANGIVGASPLIASGAAHAIAQRGGDNIAVAFMGDGATNQGMFHEALNFASVFDLPALFVIENNLYGEFTPLAKHCRVARLSDRAAAYGMHGETVDGNDVWAVYQATQRARERAARGDGPTLLECLTYRWHGHMEGEAVPYRPAEEIARWKAACPILRWQTTLEEQGVLNADQGARLSTTQQQQIEAVLQEARAAAEPAPETLDTDVFAPDLEQLFRPAPARPAQREITCSQALYEALEEELARDPRTYLLGEDVAGGGYFAVTVGLAERFGRERIVDTPISEYAIVGSAVGAAMAGARPIAEILFSDFITTCMDPLVNQAAKLRYMSGGQCALPLVVRTPGGAGLGVAAQHSQSLEALLTGVPGLIIVAPATPYDAKGLLKAAIRSNNPVLFFENKLLYATTGKVPEGEYLVPLGVADVKRSGADLTIVSVGAVLDRVSEAVETLASEGVDVEVVDVRTLVPLDLATIVRSVCKTGRLITVEDAPLCHGFGSEIIARVVETAFGALRSAPRRVAGRDVPIPYNSTLENLALPDVSKIVQAARASCA